MSSKFIQTKKQQLKTKKEIRESFLIKNNKMHTETDPMINNMQQQQHHHHQHYMSHLSHDHLLPEHHQQQHVFTHLPSATTITNNTAQQTSLPATTISLNEGLYTSPHLTSECPSQYYSAPRLNCSTSSCSTSSTSSSSNDSSSYPCSSSSSDTCNKNKNGAPSIGVNLRVTGQCSQGGRKYMEDYFSVAYQQSENAKDLEYAFIGIYDGHGGAEAAKFAKEHLMMEIINQRLFWSDNDHDVLRAIREGYIATHYAMWREQGEYRF